MDSQQQLYDISGSLTPEEALERANIKMNEGRSLQPNWSAAADCYQEALRILTKQFGDLSPQCAYAYFSYGEAILLNDMETEDDDEDDDDESEDEAPLQLAWELLECARLSFSKMAGVEAAQNYEQAIKDFTDCLSYLSQCVEPNDRHVAEVYHNMATTYMACKAYTEAEQACYQSYQLVESRLAQLAPFSPELHELQQLKELLNEQIEEIRQQPEAHKIITDAWGHNSIETWNNSANRINETVTNISGCARRGEIPTPIDPINGLDMRDIGMETDAMEDDEREINLEGNNSMNPRE
eukprot:Ihof_evm13s88 gene=Ihof_evmTU13s88